MRNTNLYILSVQKDVWRLDRQRRQGRDGTSLSPANSPTPIPQSQVWRTRCICGENREFVKSFIKVTASMCQSDDIVSIKQWDIHILLDLYYNGAPEPMITQLLSVVVNSYHHARTPPSKGCGSSSS